MIKDRIEEFEAFLDGEVSSATSELEDIEERSRKHLQKLVYTNLVDRFDSMVDHVLLDNAFNETLLGDALKILDDPLSEGETLRLFVDTSKAKTHVDNRIQETLRNTLLRSRHSQKVTKLVEVFWPSENMQKPRVNISTGKIFAKFKQQNNRIPTSLTGYCDWLYSRRNAVVHGGGSARIRMLDNDIARLAKSYNCKPAETIRLSLGSIKTATTFYRGMIGILKQGN